MKRKKHLTILVCPIQRSKQIPTEPSGESLVNCFFASMKFWLRIAEERILICVTLHQYFQTLVSTSLLKKDRGLKTLHKELEHVSHFLKTWPSSHFPVYCCRIWFYAKKEIALQIAFFQHSNLTWMPAPSHPNQHHRKSSKISDFFSYRQLATIVDCHCTLSPLWPCTLCSAQ